MSWTNATRPAHIRPVTADDPDADVVLDSLVHLHATCILNDHTMATFIPPLSFERMRERWRTFLSEAKAGKRVILVCVSAIDERREAPHDVRAPFDAKELPSLASGEEVAGTVSLSMPESETGPFRGLVQNLFVSPYHRRKGIAAALLDELEHQALQHDRWNLMLDTTQGSAAEALYVRLGWEKLGVVKDYGLDPRDGQLLDEVFFWKDIRSREE